MQLTLIKISRAALLSLSLIIVGVSVPSAVYGKSRSKGCNKKFKKALVIAGGGISPGIAIGLLAGARAAGQKPDVVITACGSSIGAAIANLYPNPQDAKAFIESKKFQTYMRSVIHVGETSPASIGSKLVSAMLTPGDHVPDIFDNNIMNVDPNPPRLLPRQTFTQSPGETRLITLATKALFTKDDVNQPVKHRALYKQTYFTDSDTARSLKKLPATMKRNIPNTWVDPDTEVRSDVSTILAARASISDPYLVQPANIKGETYFGGALDLYPIETANAVACETLATWPSSGYSDMEDGAVKNGFGFSQAERAGQLGKYKGVRWIDMRGADEVKMDPDIDGLSFKNNMPEDHDEWVSMIDKQYEFGYRQALKSYGMNPDSPSDSGVQAPTAQDTGDGADAPVQSGRGVDQ